MYPSRAFAISAKLLHDLYLKLTRIAVQTLGSNNFEKPVMCRNIKTLFNYTPTVTEVETT